MNSADFQLQGVGDPRLAVHAASALPAWLWSLDGARILWANPVGAGVFGAANASALASRNFDPADPHRRQVAQLADRLSPTGAVRLERLRGFGAALGGLVTCACARLDFSDGGSGILITAAEPAGRGMPLVERLQRLVDGIDTPIAAFARDGLFVGASDAARSLLGFRDLTEAGLDAARDDALRDGRAETPIGPGHMVLQRVGSGSDVGLVALLVPGARITPQHCTRRPRLNRNSSHWRRTRRPYADATRRVRRTRGRRNSRSPHRTTTRRANPRRTCAVIHCASCGRWMPRAVSRSGPTNSPA